MNVSERVANSRNLSKNVPGHVTDLKSLSKNLVGHVLDKKHLSENSKGNIKKSANSVKHHEKVMNSKNTITIAEIQARMRPQRQPTDKTESINIITEEQDLPPELGESEDEDLDAEPVPKIASDDDDGDDDEDGDEEDDVGLEKFMKVIRERAERGPTETPGIISRICRQGSCWSFRDFIQVIDDRSSEKILAATEGASQKRHKIFVTLDSGAVAHCASPRDLPGSITVDRDVEIRNFVGANGEPIEHWGAAKVRLQQRDGSHISNVFQVMDVCRPLHSVSMIADQGFDTVFTKTGAVVIPAGLLDELIATISPVAQYQRLGGLYVTEVTPKDPAMADQQPFAGPGASR